MIWTPEAIDIEGGALALPWLLFVIPVSLAGAVALVLWIRHEAGAMEAAEASLDDLPHLEAPRP